MGHEPVLIPNWTLFIQVGIFLASYFVLRKLVFDPFIELMEARRAKTVDLQAKAEASKKQAKEYQEKYEQFMEEEKKKISAWLEQNRRSVTDEERGILQAARDQSTTYLQSHREKVNEEVSEAKKELQPKVPQFASLIASKLLGQEVHVNTDPSSSRPNDATSVEGRVAQR